MLTDYWVIAQLLAEVCSLILLMNNLFFGVKALRFWSINTNNELQLQLEKEVYLISFTIQFIFIFQIISLIIFLYTVNQHFPKIIKGAMCATGTLNANPLGYWVLFLKLGGILIYSIFIIINYFDNNEPNYPLTPFKFWLLFPAIILVSSNLTMMIQYFYSIKPDIIATCCSVNFIESSTQDISQNVSNYYINGSLMLFFGSGLLLSISQIIPKSQHKFINIIRFMLTLIFIFTAIYSLKYFFVSYIYGVPSHYCLFDLFLNEHNYLGYLLSGCYFAIFFSNLFSVLFQLTRNILEQNFYKEIIFLNRISLISITLSILIPSLFWLFWEGSL